MRSIGLLPALGLALLAGSVASARGPATPVWVLVRADASGAALVLTSTHGAGKGADAAHRAVFGWPAQLQKLALDATFDEEAAHQVVLAAACEKLRPKSLRRGAKVKVLGPAGPETRTLGACAVTVIGGPVVEVRLALDGAAPKHPTLALVGGGEPKDARWVANPVAAPTPELMKRLETFVHASRREHGELPVAPQALAGRVRYHPPTAAVRLGFAEVCVGELLPSGDVHVAAPETAPWCEGVELVAVDGQGAPVGFVDLDFDSDKATRKALPLKAEPCEYGISPVAELTFGASWGVLVQMDGIGHQLVDLVRFESGQIVYERLYGFVVE